MREEGGEGTIVLVHAFSHNETMTAPTEESGDVAMTKGRSYLEDAIVHA